MEVHNTHGERHLYTLRPAGAEGEAFSASMDKDFYVSPFISSEGRYHVTVRDEPDGCASGSTCGRSGSWCWPPAWSPCGAGSHARPRVDAGSAPAHHARDDRDDPLARASAVSPRCPVPSAWRAPVDGPCRWRYDPVRRHPMSLRTVAARAVSRGPLAEAGRRLALEVARRIVSDGSPCCCPTARATWSGCPADQRAR